MSALLVATFATVGIANPVRRTISRSCISDPNYGPHRGESLLYSDSIDKGVPFPAEITDPVPATTTGHAGEDDILFSESPQCRVSGFQVLSTSSRGVQRTNLYRSRSPHYGISENHRDPRQRSRPSEATPRFNFVNIPEAGLLQISLWLHRRHGIFGPSKYHRGVQYGIRNGLSVASSDIFHRGNPCGNWRD